ncbi:MAG: hypothetical protein HQL74_06270 [Magnetococcales bacterium]|nr:hypothetical protein [Magnetococcales bacterium]
MADDEERAKKLLEIILRSDGSLRYDRITPKQMEELLDQEILADSGMEMMMDLAEEGTFQPLQASLGCINPDFFPRASQTIASTLTTTAIENSRFAIPLARALRRTLADLDNRLPSAIQAQNLATDREGNAKILQEIMDLETSCLCGSGNGADHDQCRLKFWQLWEFAWARRIFEPDDSVIEILEKLYFDNPFLEIRSGQRRQLKPPGSIQDPRTDDNTRGHQ